MADTRLEVVRIHPLGECRAVGDRLPDLLARLRKVQFPLNRAGHVLFFFESNF
jgi:hypothetical protein